MARPRRRGKLKDDHRAFVVQRLATFDTPKEVVDALKREFGIELTPQGAEAYDPGKRAGRQLSQRWRDLFDATRAKFLAKLEEIPAANKAVRVRWLERMALKAEERGNFQMAALMLKQIAEELGNVYTNTRQVSGKVDHDRKYADWTDEQLNQRLTALLAPAMVSPPPSELPATNAPGSQEQPSGATKH
jgi:hypothetical protein